MFQSLQTGILVLMAFLLSGPGSGTERTWAQESVKPPRPHVVFFLIDDLGFSDCGFNGGDQIRTPEIDKLARGGVILENHYVQPVCSPTRAALLTGRLPTRTGVYNVIRPRTRVGLSLEERLLSTTLQAAGYETAIVGKWHLGEYLPEYLPTRRGFDHQHGLWFGAGDHFTHTRDNIADWHHDDQPLDEPGYSTELLTSEACRLIAKRDPAKRLFLYVPYNAVHAPLQAPEKYEAPYQQLGERRRKLAGMLAAVDFGIGQVVRQLEESGMRDETLIIFSSDNGGPQPGINRPLRGFKGGLYEGGIRGCAFANWPGHLPAGQRLTQPIQITDWYPTLARLAGAEPTTSTSLDGRDIWPVLAANAPSPHAEILVAKSPTEASLRVGDWKLIRHSVAPKPADQPAKGTAGKRAAGQAPEMVWELYDLKNDPGEQQELSASQPEKFSEMKKHWEQALKSAVPPLRPEAAGQ